MTYDEGNSAKEEMMKSNLPKEVLGKIKIKLSDTDYDGMLDNDEVAFTMHLIDLPEQLPQHLVLSGK